MSIPASCFAAVALLLCLNLVSGWMGADRTLPPAPPRPEPSWRRFGRVGTATANIRAFSGRSATGEELMLAGDDMVLTDAQYRRLYQGVRGRSAGQAAGKPWTNGVIPYEITPGIFTKDQVDWIMRAMRKWETDTCVRFREARSTDKNKLVLIKDNGCYSGLGMHGGSQKLSLADSCFYRAAPEHELGHAMGLIHEHQRSNRDDFIKVNYFAVEVSRIFHLAKYAEGSDDKLGLPYDYHSIMHYEKNAFAESSEQTIYPRMNSKTDVLGLAMGPSFYDNKLINLRYNCKDRCQNPPVCREPCFVNEKCQCYCESDAPAEVCQDHKQTCADEAAFGMCERHKGDMTTNCRRTCGVCSADGKTPQLPCVDRPDFCPGDTCPADRTFFCKKSCNLCNDNHIQPPCQDSLYDCRQRAERGECDKDPKKMLKECTRSCDFCLGERLPPRTCEDEDSVCVLLKTLGACQSFLSKTSQFCKRSCNNCDGHVVLPAYCVDDSPHCFLLSWDDTCDVNGKMCKQSCNECGVNGVCEDFDPTYCKTLGDFACPLHEYRSKCQKTCKRCKQGS